MINVTEKQYDAWTQDLEKIHTSLDTWYKFVVGFIGERKKLLEAKEGIEKLKMLTEFLRELKPQVFK